jgi:hypothetical protein
MLTISNFKSIEFLRNLFSKAIQDWENNKEFYLSEQFDLKYYKVAIEYANRFRDLGFFQEVDDVIDYLEKPHKFQDELYLIKLFDLSIVYKQDYSQWLKDIDCPKEMEIDVVDVIEYMLHNNYSIHWINDILDELEQDFAI